MEIKEEEILINEKIVNLSPNSEKDANTNSSPSSTPSSASTPNKDKERIVFHAHNEEEEHIKYYLNNKKKRNHSGKKPRESKDNQKHEILSEFKNQLSQHKTMHISSDIHCKIHNEFNIDCYKCKKQRNFSKLDFSNLSFFKRY